MGREEDQARQLLKRKVTSIGRIFVNMLVLAVLFSVWTTAAWAMGMWDLPENPPTEVYSLPDVTVYSLSRTFISHVTIFYVFFLVVSAWNEIRSRRK